MIEDIVKRIRNHKTKPFKISIKEFKKLGGKTGKLYLSSFSDLLSNEGILPIVSKKYIIFLPYKFLSKIEEKEL